jgi:hypothetical protein
MATSKQSITDRKTAAAQQAAADADYSARVSLAFYNFFKCHWREGLQSCESNKRALEDWLDANLLDCSTPANLEIAYLAVGSKMARTAQPTPPTPPEPPAAVTPPVEQLSESDQLRKLLRENKEMTPKQIANFMRAKLKVGDVQGKQAATRLPDSITKEHILKCGPERQRFLASRYGNKALNDRLQGIS